MSELTKRFIKWRKKSLIKVQEGDDNLIVESRKEKKSFKISVFKTRGKGFKLIKSHRRKTFEEADKKFNKIVEEF